MELQGERRKACKGKNPKKVETLRGENSQKTLEYIGGECDNSNLSLHGGQGGAPPGFRLWRLNIVAGGLRSPQSTLQEGITPFSKAPKTVPGLLGIGTTRVLQPFSEEVFIFL